MKKAMKVLIISAFLLALPIAMIAQTPPHPNGGNPPGGGNVPVGGGAPIDGGLSIMLILGAAYGSRKVYKLKK
jgi:hypothetical protein